MTHPRRLLPPEAHRVDGVVFSARTCAALVRDGGLQRVRDAARAWHDSDMANECTAGIDYGQAYSRAVTPAAVAPVPLLTVDQAAMVLCCSERTVRRYVAQGLLSTLRRGRGPHRIPAEEVYLLRAGQAA